MKTEYSLSSAGSLLGMLGDWCANNDMHTLQAFIKSKDDAQVYLCELKVSKTTVDEMEKIKASAATQQRSRKEVFQCSIENL